MQQQKRLNEVQSTIPTGISGGQFASDTGALTTDAPAPAGRRGSMSVHLPDQVTSQFVGDLFSEMVDKLDDVSHANPDSGSLLLTCDYADYLVEFEQQEPSSVAVFALAEQLHDAARLPRLRLDGTYEPEVVTTSDVWWIGKSGTDQVDVANSSYLALPSDLRQEIDDSARTAIKAVRSVEDPNLNSPDVWFSLGSVLQDAWRERNCPDGGEPLDVDFGNLSTSDQEQLLAQAAAVIDLGLQQPWHEVRVVDAYGNQLSSEVFNSDGGWDTPEERAAAHAVVSILDQHYVDARIEPADWYRQTGPQVSDLRAQVS